jgi:hypothetical protein
MVPNHVRYQAALRPDFFGPIKTSIYLAALSKQQTQNTKGAGKVNINLYRRACSRIPQIRFY